MYKDFNYHGRDNTADDILDDDSVGDFVAVYEKDEDLAVLTNSWKHARDKEGNEYIIMNKSKNYQEIMHVIERNKVLGMERIILAKIIKQVISTRKNIGSYYEIEIEK